MIDKLLPLIKEHFDESEWTVTTETKKYFIFDANNKPVGEKFIECIYIEHKIDFTKISIAYDSYEKRMHIGGRDIPYDTYRLIHDIIEEAKHDIKTVRCQKCGAIIDTPGSKYKYYTGMEYYCKACGNTGFIKTEDIWTTTE